MLIVVIGCKSLSGQMLVMRHESAVVNLPVNVGTVADRSRLPHAGESRLLAPRAEKVVPLRRVAC